MVLQKPRRGWLEEFAHDADMLGRGTQKIGTVRATRIEREHGEDGFIRVEGHAGNGLETGAAAKGETPTPPSAPADDAGDSSREAEQQL